MTEHKYTLVIRFNREELDTENPQNLLQGMNRQVVYHKPEDDITVSVLDYLNRKFTDATSPPAATPCFADARQRCIRLAQAHEAQVIPSISSSTFIASVVAVFTGWLHGRRACRIILLILREDEAQVVGEVVR